MPFAFQISQGLTFMPFLTPIASNPSEPHLTSEIDFPDAISSTLSFEIKFLCTPVGQSPTHAVYMGILNMISVTTFPTGYIFASHLDSTQLAEIILVKRTADQQTLQSTLVTINVDGMAMMASIASGPSSYKFDEPITL